MKFEALKKYCNSLVKISDDEWSDFERHLSVKKIKKKELILKQGQICDYVAFINTGFLRMYHTLESVEKTTGFFIENFWVTDYSSFLTGSPSIYHIQALEPCELVFLYKKDMNYLYNKHHSLDKMGRLIAEFLYVMIERRSVSLLLDSAETRWEKLQQQFSPLLQRVPQYMIASFLGITPEALSRIKSKKVRQ